MLNILEKDGVFLNFCQKIVHHFLNVHTFYFNGCTNSLLDKSLSSFFKFIKISSLSMLEILLMLQDDEFFVEESVLGLFFALVFSRSSSNLIFLGWARIDSLLLTKSDFVILKSLTAILILANFELFDEFDDFLPKDNNDDAAVKLRY